MLLTGPSIKRPRTTINKNALLLPVTIPGIININMHLVCLENILAIPTVKVNTLLVSSPI